MTTLTQSRESFDALLLSRIEAAKQAALALEADLKDIIDGAKPENGFKRFLEASVKGASSAHANLEQAMVERFSRTKQADKGGTKE